MSQLADFGSCVACSAELPPLGEPIEIAAARELDQIVHHARVPVLVDFWAPWCVPCRQAAPEVAAVSARLAGRALVIKVNTDRSPDLAQRFGVTGIPSFIVFRDGRLLHRTSGVTRRAQMEAWLAA